MFIWHQYLAYDAFTLPGTYTWTGTWNKWILWNCVEVFTLYLNRTGVETYCPSLFWSQSLFLSRSLYCWVWLHRISTLAPSTASPTGRIELSTHHWQSYCVWTKGMNETKVVSVWQRPSYVTFMLTGLDRSWSWLFLHGGRRVCVGSHVALHTVYLYMHTKLQSQHGNITVCLHEAVFSKARSVLVCVLVWSTVQAQRI